jgi:small-conductance mechanosensitive channel
MLTLILSISLLVSLAGLGVEIGIASWNIRRANRYRRRAYAAEHTAERAVGEQQDMEKRMEYLDDYTSKIFWLLKFLYNRYNKFPDLETEVQDGLKDVDGNTSIGEADTRYKDLKKALKLIRVTMKASERMEDLMNSITDQLSQIRKDLDEEDEESESPESDKSAESKPESPSEPTATEAKAPDAEVPNL